MPIHFTRPEWLWLLPIALLWLYWVWRNRRQQGWASLLPAAIAERLTHHSGKYSHNTPWLLGLWLAISCIALAGPSLKPEPVIALSGGNARVIVLDMSMSMRATDAAPDRLHIARYKALDLLKAWKGGETGLVTFAGQGFVISPLSNDNATLANLIPHLNPEIMPAQGSNLADGIKKATQLLQQSGYNRGDIVVIGDSIEAHQISDINKELEKQHFRFSFMAVGSSEGAPIKLENGQLLKNDHGEIIVPKVDLAPIIPVCRSHGGICERVTADSSDVQAISQLSGLDHSTQGKQAKSTNRQWQDQGYWLLLPILLLWLFKFRSSSLYGVLIVCGLSFSMPKPSYAVDLWQNKPQQAEAAFEHHDYEQAAKLYQSPQWQGAAWYKAGKYKQALQAFKQDNSATGWYNQGNAQMQLHQYQKAVEAYNQALKLDPKLNQAKHNKAIAESLLKKQQQQKSQQQSQKSSGDSKKQDKQQQQQQQNNAGGSKQKQSQNASKGGNKANPKDPQNSNENKNNHAGQKNKAQPTEQDQQAQSGQSKQSKPSTEPDQHTATANNNQQGSKDLKQLQHWLNQIPNDPSLLLKNQMQMEYQQHHHRQSEENW